MPTIIGGVQGLTTETASPTSTTEDYASTSSSGNVQLVTITVTQGESASITPTTAATSESGLITAAPNTASSSVTLIYVYTTPIIASSPSKSPSSSQNHNTSGLSPGAIAGIVIGSLVFLIILVLIVFCGSRGFARKKRRETLLITEKGYASQARSHPHTRSATPRPPPQELATQYNQLEIGGRGKPADAVGTHLHPAELQAGSINNLADHVWNGRHSGVAYLSPDGRGGEAVSDGGMTGGHLTPGSWETVSSASVPGQTQAQPSTSTSRATSAVHNEEEEARKNPS